MSYRTLVKPPQVSWSRIGYLREAVRRAIRVMQLEAQGQKPLVPFGVNAVRPFKKGEKP